MQVSLRCIHPTAYFYIGQRPLSPSGEWALTTSPAPIPLDGPDGRTLYLTVSQSFRTRKHKGQWKVSTAEYIYNVGETENTHDYMFAWHWHPELMPVECHLHAKADLANGMKLNKKHLPTARITFEEVLRFLIAEFDVTPAQKDWQPVLAETQKRHEKYRSWSGSRKP